MEAMRDKSSSCLAGFGTAVADAAPKRPPMFTSIPPVDEPYVGAWMAKDRRFKEYTVGELMRQQQLLQARRPPSLLLPSHHGGEAPLPPSCRPLTVVVVLLLQTLYETRCASLQRLVGFFVLFHAMGKAS